MIIPPLRLCTVLIALFAVAGLPTFLQADPDVAIEVLPDHPLGEIYNFWSVMNFTDQDMFGDPDQFPRIATRHPFMREVNCIRLIGGRMDGKNDFFRGVDEEGRAICDFTLLIDYIGGILEAGFSPWLVLDKVPVAMSPGREMRQYGNAYPPDDYDLYHDYVGQLVSALVEAFGYPAVSQWRFRVATEPDLKPGHWDASREEFFKLYDYVVDAVTRVIPDADIGPGNILNPLSFRGVERPVWGLDIIDHAATGTNTFNGGTGTRMTHFSCSWYDRIGEEGDVRKLSQVVDTIRRRLDRYPQFRKLPVDVAEFMILHDVNSRRLYSGDVTEWSASWLAAVTEQVYDKGIGKIHFWNYTTGGVYHPQAHVITFLEEMLGGQRLESVVRASRGAYGLVGALAARRDGALYLMLYHHDQGRSDDQVLKVRLAVREPDGAVSTAWLADHRQVDKDRGVFIRQLMEDCRAAGLEPLENSAEFDGAVHRMFGEEGVAQFNQNIEKYRVLSNDIVLGMEQSVKVENGELILELELPAHSVRMIRLYPAD